ncbi:uncharacterized protein [Pyxicephalus adspersus]|uniref:uncharacterized protein n=1 Tax=Pyxicephalus adspersus TaxID=30357 RepID=UPI003B5CB8E4
MRQHANMHALNLDTYSLSLITAKEDILNQRISTDWAVFTYERKWSLKLMDSGVGGLEELMKKFNKNLVLYGLCQVPDPNTQGPRFILIYWVGENVDASQKEISMQHLPAIRRFFKEATVMLRAQRIEDISQEAVTQALNKVPQPARPFHRPRIPGSHEVVGTNYTKTNPAIEMKFSMRDSFWQRNEREEEKRKEQERLRLQEERIAMEKARIERERLEEEERERRIQEKEKMVEEQRKEQARLEAEQRRIEKARWAQQQKEFEEEMKGRFRRSQSIEMAAEAAALVSGRSLHPRDIFRQHERSVSCSNSPPSTPSSPLRSPSSFSNRTTFRYQRSMTESILTPSTRSPSYFPGFQKRDSFSGPSSSSPQTCSPAFIFSKAPLPGTSPKMDSLPSFIPPPISAKRGSTSHVKENVSPQRSLSPHQSSSSTSPSQNTISPIQSSISAPQCSMSPPQRSISAPQSSISAPQSSISSPQSSISAPQSSISTPQSSIFPSQNSISPHQSFISPSQSSISPPKSSISPPQMNISPQPYPYDVPFRAEYVMLTSEESPQPNNTYNEKYYTNKAQTRPPALTIPPPTNVDIPDATNILSDEVYRAEFVPVESLNTPEDLVEPGNSSKLLKSIHTPEGPAAIKATVSVSTPVSEIGFASITPISDSKITTSPFTSEASEQNSTALGPTFAPHEVSSDPALSTQASVELSEQRTLSSSPASITAGKPPDTKSNFYTVSSYQSHASSKTTSEGLLPSPLPDPPRTLEAKTSTSLKSILQYVAPPPYTPFSARTTDSITVKAPAFGRSLSSSSRLASSSSSKDLPEISSAPNVETPTVNSKQQLEPQIPPCVESQEHSTYHLSDQPLRSPATKMSDIVDSSPSYLATIGQPESQPIEYKAKVSPVDNFNYSSPQIEPNKEQSENLALQVRSSTGNLPETTAEPIYSQTEVPPAETQTEPIDTTCKILPAQVVSINNLPEPQGKADVPPTEDLPSSASLPTIPPEIQAESSKELIELSLSEPLPLLASLSGVLPEYEKQSEVSLVESLPVETSPSNTAQAEVPPPEVSSEEPILVVASLARVVPETQDEFSEKQAEVSHVESLPVVASLSASLAESQEELHEEQRKVFPAKTLPVVTSVSSIVHESQTEVPLVEPLPMVTSRSSIEPESQAELSKKQTEVPQVEPLPVVTFRSTSLPESQDELNKNQTEVPSVESLPLVTSLSSNEPESQAEFSEKQTEAPQVEPLPVMTFLSTSLPESQDELNKNQTEVPSVESLPLVTSLSSNEPESQAEFCEKQTEVPLVESLPVVAFHSGIEPESQAEFGENQTAVPPVESLLVVASHFGIESEPQAELSENQTAVPPGESLPVVTTLSSIEPEPQAELSENQTAVPPGESLPVVASLSSIEPEPQAELSENQTEVPPVGLPSSAPLCGPADLESLSEDVVQPTEDLLVETIGVDVTYYSHSVASCNQTELPQVGINPVPEDLPSESFTESHVDTLPMSSSSERSPESEYAVSQPAVPSDEAIENPVSLPTDISLKSEETPSNDQDKVFQTQTPSGSSTLESTNLQPEDPVKAEISDFNSTDGSPKYQTEDLLTETLSISNSQPSDNPEYQADRITITTNIPPKEIISESTNILQSESQEQSGKINTEVPPSESLSSSFSPNGSLGNQAKAKQIEASNSLPVTDCESPGEPINNQIESSLPATPSISTQIEVPSLPALPVTTTNSQECTPESKDEVPLDKSSCEGITLLPPDSSLGSEDEAHQTEIPSSLPVSHPSQSIVIQAGILEEDNLPVSFSIPVCGSQESLEVRYIQNEFFQTEGINESTSFPTVNSFEVQTEPNDLPLAENIWEPLPTISQPNDRLLELPQTLSFIGSVALPSDQPAESETERSEDLQPDTFIASMVLCTDQPAESDIEGNYSQSSTEPQFLPLINPSECPAEPGQVPAADPVNLDDCLSTSVADSINTAPPVDSSLLSVSFTTNSLSDPNGNLIEVESPPLTSSMLISSPSEFLSPPTTTPCGAEEGALQAPLVSESLPSSNLNLFEDPHPGSPPVSGVPTEQSSDKVIVHNILPINNLPAEENQTLKDLSLCNSDFVDHKDSMSICTEEALQTTESDIPENNNTVPSEVVL